jgi:aconitate hydratase
MLGQPVYLLTPDVVGFEMSGQLREGVTATDLVLTVTEILRQHKVVGKFVEFYGAGTASLTLPDRATIANMAPEYGATMGFFPVDEKTLDYFRGTGRSKVEIDAFEAYFRAQGMFGVPGAPDANIRSGEIDYSLVVKLDLGHVTPSLAGPKRPQDRIELGQVATQFASLFSKSNADNGFNQPTERLNMRVSVHPNAGKPAWSGVTEVPAGAPRDLAEMVGNRPAVAARSAAGAKVISVGNGDILIAAITSCTNTSNPGVLLAAGLLAKKAVEAGLRVQPHIKTSLAPGSRIVTEYLTQTGLLPYLEKLGFALAGYGCTTCIGNSGDLTPELNEAITKNDLVCAAVLSGNRNFEARIHPSIKANFLASPPLVVAYAIAGTVTKDLMTEPVGKGKGGRDVYLGDIWPTSAEIHKFMKAAMNGKAYRENYERMKTEPGKLWERIQGVDGDVYNWPESSYIAEPPFFNGFSPEAPLREDAAVKGARIMALFGDSITTDHISPAGAIQESSPAGQWLRDRRVQKADFNSFGARRGHHEVMMRGTFGNVRIKNLMLPADASGSRTEGGWTLYEGQGDRLPMYDAAMRYQEAGVGSVIFAGEEYGTGSSRDWAAKGTQLLGIRAVVARSFERIHRSNLVGMGVLPLQFKAGTSWERLGLNGDETIDVIPHPDLKPQSEAKLVIHTSDGRRREVKLLLRIDTPVEVAYYRAGGILPYVLRQLLTA